VPAAFERAVRALIQRREFWQRFTEVPDIAIDTAAVARAWKAAREAVLAALHAKQGAPLDGTVLPATALAAIASYDESRDAVMAISGALQVINAQIAIAKEQAAAANVVMFGLRVVYNRAGMHVVAAKITNRRALIASLRARAAIVAGLNEFFLGLGRAKGESISIGGAFHDGAY
jgi:hypothetical protein